jgi:hypothetical protein
MSAKTTTIPRKVTSTFAKSPSTVLNSKGLSKVIIVPEVAVGFDAPCALTEMGKIKTPCATTNINNIIPQIPFFIFLFLENYFYFGTQHLYSPGTSIGKPQFSPSQTSVVLGQLESVIDLE